MIGFNWPVRQIETEKRRLEILRFLASTPGYEATAHVLMLYCRSIGVPTTTDQMETALNWLAETALLILRGQDQHIIARITAEGREVAFGLKAVPGVLRPEP